MDIPKVLIPVLQPDGNYKSYEFAPEEIDWPEIRSLWAKYSIELPLCFAPPETKSEIFFYYACQEYGVPASLGSVYNPGWTELFLSQIKHDCFIIDETLIPYVATDGLFEKAFKRLKLLICMGVLEISLKQQLQALYPNLICKTLPHPMTMLYK